MLEAENDPPMQGGVVCSEADENRDSRPAHFPNVVTPRPVFMPETFTGSGRQWSDWSEQFDLTADVNNWDESLKLKFMSLLLSGRARDIYSGLPVQTKNNYAKSCYGSLL